MNAAVYDSAHGVHRYGGSAFQQMCGVFRIHDHRLIQGHPGDRRVGIQPVLLSDDRSAQADQLHQLVCRVGQYQNIAGLKALPGFFLRLADTQVAAGIALVDAAP